jgi:hypothetical protein
MRPSQRTYLFQRYVQSAQCVASAQRRTTVLSATHFHTRESNFDDTCIVRAREYLLTGFWVAVYDRATECSKCRELLILKTKRAGFLNVSLSLCTHRILTSFPLGRLRFYLIRRFPLSLPNFSRASYPSP